LQKDDTISRPYLIKKKRIEKEKKRIEKELTIKKNLIDFGYGKQWSDPQRKGERDGRDGDGEMFFVW